MARTAAPPARTPALEALTQVLNPSSGASPPTPPLASSIRSSQTASRANGNNGKKAAAASPAPFAWTVKAGETLLHLRFDVMKDRFQGSKSSKQLAAAWKMLAAETFRVSGLEVDPNQCKSKVKHMQKQFTTYQVSRESTKNASKRPLAEPACYKAMCDVWGDAAEMGADPSYTGEAQEDLSMNDALEESADDQIEHVDQDDNSGDENSQGSGSWRRQRGKRNREESETADGLRAIGSGLDNIAESLRLSKRQYVNSDNGQTMEIADSVKELTRAVHAQTQALNAQTQALNCLLQHLTSTGKNGTGASSRLLTLDHQPVMMLSKRRSLNDDLIIWRGMSAHNISISVRQGLSFAVRRRKIWLEIIEAEVHKKSKSIVGQNFEFSTRHMTMTSQSTVKGPTEDDQTYALPSLESRVPEIIEAMIAGLPVRINLFNEAIIEQLTLIIASELRLNAEASKVLSFILYREQVPSNRRPCIPTGSTSYAIYTDILESCIQIRDPSIYKHMLAIGVDRYVVWILLQIFISDSLPLVLRVRFLDLLLIRGCVSLVSAMLAYLTWRKETLLQTTSIQEFIVCIKQPHSEWLLNDKIEVFWTKCVSMHTQAFLDLYTEITSRMRLKAVTVSRQREIYEPLQNQQYRDIFHHSRYSWIGFDVDHTLVEYRLPYLLHHSFSQAVKELQKKFVGLQGIPSGIWLPSIAQRGVVVDTARGNFLHLGEDGSIQRAYHGSHEISHFSISVLYGNTVVSDDTPVSGILGGSSKLIHLYTAADIIYAPLYAWLVDAFDSGVVSTEEMGALYLVPDVQEEPPGNPNDPFLANKVVYVTLSRFALKAAKSFYAGSFWKIITTSPDALIQPNADIVTLLEVLKTNLGKQLFILTNGSWTHCNTVMQFAIGRNWINYFDLVVTEANKEVFFDEFNDTLFSELDVEHTGNGGAGDRRVQKHVVGILNRRKVYAHGNAKTLMTFFNDNVRRPTSSNITTEKDQRICYFGDHLMHDVLQPARFTSTWDLIAIVKEIQNLGQPTEAEDSSPSWFERWIYGGARASSPDVRSSFFFLGPSGSMTYFGKKICTVATLCLPSVGKLAHCDCVLKVGMILQGGRYVPNSELAALPKRVIAKVRSIDPNSTKT